jgi:hypothetical protein
LGREVLIDWCTNIGGVVLYSCIVPHIFAIKNRLLLLTSLSPGKRKLEEYYRLPIPLSSMAEEVHFG